MIHIKDTREIKVRWTIQSMADRHSGRISEKKFVFLCGPSNRQLVEAGDTLPLSVSIPAGLEQGEYTLEMLTVESLNSHPVILPDGCVQSRGVSRATARGVFAISDWESPEIARKPTSEVVVIDVVSQLSVKPNDGLDAYQIAVLRGETADEATWLEAYHNKLAAVQAAVEAAVQAATEANTAAAAANAKAEIAAAAAAAAERAAGDARSTAEAAAEAARREAHDAATDAYKYAVQAQDAAQQARQAVEDAERATTSTLSARQEAIAAKQEALAAAQTAEQAATAARQAVVNANNAAELARRATNEANLARDNANSAATQANNKAVEAESAAEQARRAAEHAEQVAGDMSGVKETIPTDVARSASDATFVHMKNGVQIPLFYLRGATDILAGLLSAAMYVKLRDLPDNATLTSFLNRCLTDLNWWEAVDSMDLETILDNRNYAKKDYVDRSIATNTATFKGTFSTIEELQAVTGADANDYAYVADSDLLGPRYDRYKWVDGTGWTFEYSLNVPGFGPDEWAAIKSGITEALVEKLKALPANTALTALLAAKQDLLPLIPGSGNASMRSDDTNEASGELSVAIGTRNVATHLGAMAIGKNNGARQEFAYCFGENNSTIGWDTFLAGTGNSVQRHMGMAIGRQNTVRSWAGIAVGLGLVTYDNQENDDNNGEVAFGRYNTSATGQIFSVGCGTSDDDRRNAIVVDKDGKVSFPQENTSVTDLVTQAKKIPTDVSRTATDAIFVHAENGVNTNLFRIRQATTSLAGLMTAADKVKLDNMPDSASIEALSARITALENMLEQVNSALESL